MARDAAAKRLGVPISALTKVAAIKDPEIGTALAHAIGTFSTPSPQCLARARRYQNRNVDAALQHLRNREFSTQEAADRAFEGELATRRFNPDHRGDNVIVDLTPTN